MSDPRDPDSTDPPDPSRDEVAELVRSIEERDSASGRRPESKPGRATSPFWYLLLAAAVVTGAYFWLARPVWVFGPGATAPTDADLVGRLQYRMYVQASRIESYRRTEGRLPDRLEQLEGGGEGLEYRVTPDGGWELSGQAGDTRLTLRSSDSMADFLGVP